MSAGRLYWFDRERGGTGVGFFRKQEEDRTQPVITPAGLEFVSRELSSSANDMKWAVREGRAWIYSLDESLKAEASKPGMFEPPPAVYLVNRFSRDLDIQELLSEAEGFDRVMSPPEFEERFSSLVDETEGFESGVRGLERMLALSSATTCILAMATIMWSEAHEGEIQAAIGIEAPVHQAERWWPGQTRGGYTGCWMVRDGFSGFEDAIAREAGVVGGSDLMQEKAVHELSPRGVKFRTSPVSVLKYAHIALTTKIFPDLESKGYLSDAARRHRGV